MTARSLRRLVAGVLISLASCRRPPSNQPARIAILPIENLSSSRALDWMGAGATAALDYDLTGLPRLWAVRTATPATASLLHAERAIEANYAFGRGRVRLHAVIEDPSRSRVERDIVGEGPDAQGIVPLVNQLAKEIDPAARAFPVDGTTGFEAYAKALQANDPAERERLLREAIEKSPGLAPARAQLSELLLSKGDRASAAAVASEGLRNSQNPLDRAQLDYLAALGRGDDAAAEQALSAMGRLNPADPTLLSRLAQMHATQRKVRQAILDYQTAIRLDPSDPANYNFLGYALAWAHDLEGARKALTQYRNMLPGDANPIDSLGDVNYMLGDFAAAEKLFVEAHDKDPSVRGGRELLKAAEAALFAGDLAHADANFHKFIDYQRAHHSPTIETELAQWEFLTGRRKQAMARMEKQLATGNGEVAVLSGAQLGFWKLQTGDRPGALELAMDSGRRATSPVARTQAAIVAFLAQSAPAKSSSPLVNGVALLLAHRPADAIAPLRQVFDKTHPSFDGQVRTLLAWAEVDTGRVQDAKSLVDLYPEPFTSGGEALFYSLTFPRFLELRATVLKAEQKSEEARRMEELYRKFAGDVPDRF